VVTIVINRIRIYHIYTVRCVHVYKYVFMQISCCAVKRRESPLPFTLHPSQLPSRHFDVSLYHSLTCIDVSVCHTYTYVQYHPFFLRRYHLHFWMRALVHVHKKFVFLFL